MSIIDETIQPVEAAGDSLPPPTNWKVWIGRAVAALAAIAALYLGATAWASGGSMLHAIGGLPWHVLPSVVGLVVGGWALRAVRWEYYARHLGWNVAWHHNLIVFLASFAFTATPGKAGEILKSVLLRTRHNVSMAEGVAVLMVERVGDLLAVLVLSLGGLAMLTDALIYFLIAAVLVVAAAVFVSHPAFYMPILKRMEHLPKLAGLIVRIERLLETGRALLRPTPFLIGVGLALVAWALEGWAFHILVRAFGVQTSVLTSCSIFGVATVVGALSALPGGLGSFEVVMVLLLSRLGLAAGTATLAVVIFRFCSLWLGSLTGLIFMVVWLSRIAPPAATSESKP